MSVEARLTWPSPAAAYPVPAAQRACCFYPSLHPSLQLRGSSSPFPRELAEEVDIFFSAHGVPLSYIEEGERSGRMG